MPRLTRLTRPLRLAALCLALTAGACAHTESPPAAATPQAPEASAPLSAQEARATVGELATLLEDNYVFPDVAGRYARMLRERLEAGAYDAPGSPEAFAQKLTEELASVSEDRHLRVRLKDSAPPMHRPAQGQLPPAIDEARWLAEGVAYIRFNMFPRDARTVAAVERFMAEHASAQTLIIDARPHRGGTLEVMDALLQPLYAAPTTLVRMDTRAAVERAHGSPVQEGPTLRRQPSPDTLVRRDHIATPHPTEKRLTGARVFYLTSQRTASAAEHLALALKRTRRATLVGETTAGAGHYGGTHELGERFTVFVPVGRTYDPDTNQGWEGTGVAPDVSVPADKALEEALKLAGVKTDAVVKG